MHRTKLMPNVPLDAQIAGTRKAIESLNSRRTGPVWLVPSLRKRLRALREEKKRRDARTARKKDAFRDKQMQRNAESSQKKSGLFPTMFG